MSDPDKPLLKWCARGHRWYISRIEWESYKGSLPMPCPICIRLNLREPGK